MIMNVKLNIAEKNNNKKQKNNTSAIAIFVLNCSQWDYMEHGIKSEASKLVCIFWFES